MALTPPKLVLFDMDETLGCSRSHTNALKDILAERGLEIPEHIQKKIDTRAIRLKEGDRILSMDRDGFAVQMCADDVVAYLAEKGKPMPKADYEALLDEKANANVVYQPYDGAKEFIDGLRRQNVRVGFVTDTKRNMAVQALTGMGVYNPTTDVLVDHADISGDPSPKGENKQAAIEKAINHYGYRPGKDIWYVGDTNVEAEDALKLGCTAIGYGINTAAARWLPGLKAGEVSSMYDTTISRDQIEVAPTYKSLAALLERTQLMQKPRTKE